MPKHRLRGEDSARMFRRKRRFVLSKVDRYVEIGRRFPVFRIHNRQKNGRTRCYNSAMKTGWIFLLDVLLDSVMVALALKLGGARTSAWRIALAALLGAAAARMCAGLPVWGRALLWLPIAMGMMAAACGRALKPLRAAGLLLAAAGLMGGTIQALSGAAGSKTRGMLLGVLAVPLITAAMVRALRTGRDVQTVRVRMTYQGRTAEFSAMVDSGNCLRDYLTHRPVIVMPQARGNRLFGLEGTPLRPIFADTAGGRQMMLCLLPDETILGDGETERAVEAILALSPGLGGNAPALLPTSLLNQKDGQEGA